MCLLENKKILVVGATGGIGKSITDILNKNKAILCISGTSEEKLNNLKNEVNPSIHSIQCNLSNVEETTNLVNKAYELLNGLDGVVFNAGITRDKLAIKMSLSDWDEVININLKAAFIINSEAAKKMFKQKSGSIVNVASVVGCIGNPGQANYAASKAGMIMMGKSIAKELAARGVRVNTVAPGFIDTPMTAVLPETYKTEIANSIPMKRMGNPDEIAHVIKFLLSDESSYITGQTIIADGGLS